MIATFTRAFSAAHRVWNDPGKCRNIHGHNYAAVVMIDSPSGPLTEQGFVVPFAAVKDAIDAYDHTLILHADDPLVADLRVFGPETAVGQLRIVKVPSVPSTENLATLLATAIAAAVIDSMDPAASPFTVTVGLRETDGIHAEATVESW